MRITKDIKRENGDKLLIRMDFRNTYHGDSFVTSVAYTPKGKRKPIWDSGMSDFVDKVMDYKFRSLSLEDKQRKITDFLLQYVSISELEEIRNELLSQMTTIPVAFI